MDLGFDLRKLKFVTNKNVQVLIIRYHEKRLAKLMLM